MCPDFDGDSGEDGRNDGHLEGKKLSLIVIEEHQGRRLVGTIVCAIGHRQVPPARCPLLMTR